MLRGLLGSGCSKATILKKFTARNSRVKLNDKGCAKYETYGGYFKPSAAATVSLSLVEFTKYRHKVG